MAGPDVGHISGPRQTKKGPRWDARYPIGGGKFRSKACTSERSAKALLRAWRNEAEEGGASFSANATKITVKDFALNTWLPNVTDWAPATLERRTSIVNHHIIPTLGHYRVQALTYTHVNEWVSKLKAAPTTAKVIHATLRLMLNASIKHGIRRRGDNPASGVKTPRDNRAKLPVLEHEQVLALIDAAEPQHRAAVALAAYCGLRAQEVAGVRRSDLSFVSNRPTLVTGEPTIHVERQVYCPKGSKPVPAPPKSARGDRVIPLPAALVTILGDHLRDFPLGVDGTLFHNDGELIHRTEMNRIMNRAKKMVGLTYRGKAWHLLRHYFATTLAAGGINLVVVAAYLGDTVQATVDTYLHVCPSDAARTVALLDAIIAEAGARSSRDGMGSAAL